MKHESLFPIPDEGRTSWLFLLLEVDQVDYTLTSWAAGVGHSERLLDRQVFNDTDEGTPLVALCDFLSGYQYQEVILITTSDRTLHQLRTCLNDSTDIGQATLRGFSHVSMRSLITEYFVTESAAMVSTTELPPTIEGLNEAWEVFSELVPLVPISSIRGEPL